ncbi:hypothetical protein [Cohnella thailandensis]|uniref:Uncharacterized protein n=1 Tax=Cohnella thailandensis TaxID=557557 RepID=A0A841T8A1_9BACL|nr:hypothetical protein [Cohnella thailandensis]MBB6638077.1 hypothetical protein [Cohnella thailandensis]MBP1971997.1 hypothetical protein [Cohnella thailandensis]
MKDEWITYAPVLMFDEREPFYPVRVGVSELRDGESSPSFRRTMSFSGRDIDRALEYAIYWDYDIQHLYELEHVWLYLRKDGTVADAEASFHGRYLKALLPDRSNLSGNKVILYSQPGKHAFAPLPLLFRLLPNADECTDKEAGRDGLTAPDWLGSDSVRLLMADEGAQRLVREHIRSRFRFAPSYSFLPYELGGQEDLFVPWTSLLKEIPLRIEREMAFIRGSFGE